MKKMTKNLLLASAIFSTSSVHAMLGDISPYVGGGYEWTKMGHGNKGFGFVKSYSGGNFFVGLQWCNIGIEGGYDCAKKSNNQSTVPLQNSYAVPLGFGTQSTSVSTKIRTKFSEGWHVDFNGYLPILNSLELIGSIGFGKIKASANTDIRTVNTLNSGPGITISNSYINGVFVPGNSDSTVSVAHNKNKTVLRLGAGLQYMVFDNVGIRGIFRWKNTSRVRVSAIEGTIRRSIASRDGISLEAGLFLRF